MRGGRKPFWVLCRASTADVSGVLPPMTFWERAGPAARARRQAVSAAARTTVLIVVKNTIAWWFLVRGCARPSAGRETIPFLYRRSLLSIHVTFIPQNYGHLPKPDETVLRVLHTSFFRDFFPLKAGIILYMYLIFKHIYILYILKKIKKTAVPWPVGSFFSKK
jgi:hypothetical protein